MRCSMLPRGSGPPVALTARLWMTTWPPMFSACAAVTPAVRVAPLLPVGLPAPSSSSARTTSPGRMSGVKFFQHAPPGWLISPTPSASVTQFSLVVRRTPLATGLRGDGVGAGHPVSAATKAGSGKAGGPGRAAAEAVGGARRAAAEAARKNIRRGGMGADARRHGHPPDRGVHTFFIAGSPRPVRRTRMRTLKGESAANPRFRPSGGTRVASSTHLSLQCRRLLDDLVARAHARGDVVVDVAVQQPDPAVVGDHVGRLHAAAEDLQDVGAHAHRGHGVAVPVRRVQVDLGAEAHRVPADALAELGLEGRMVLIRPRGTVAED